MRIGGADEVKDLTDDGDEGAVRGGFGYVLEPGPLGTEDIAAAIRQERTEELGVDIGKLKHVLHV